MNISKFMKSAVTAAAISVASPSAVAERFIIQVDNQNKGVVTALSRQMGGDVHIESDGFISVSFAGKNLEQVKGLLNNPHIKLIEIDRKRYLYNLSNHYQDSAGDPMAVQVVPYAINQSNASDASITIRGDGIKVCVIDSGLDRSNIDFTWTNITGTNLTGTGNWDSHGGPHGTHVAGTIAAEDNGFGVIGMAPNTSLHIIKVFNEDGWGYSSSLADAALECSEREVEADVISMSLGGIYSSATEENVFQEFVDNGGLVVAAAGNDYNNARSYPAGYSSVMMVGANDGDNKIADFSQYPDCTVVTGRGRKQKVKEDKTVCVEVTAGGVNTLSTYPASMATVNLLFVDELSYSAEGFQNSIQDSVNAPTINFGFGDSAAITAVIQNDNLTSLSGYICVMSRGGISFIDKVNNCSSLGGIGAIIINNEDGMINGTLGDDDSYIPVVGALQADFGAIMPSANTDDIGTVGAEAYLTVGLSNYGFMSGTSMATPAVAGVAALVWSNFSDCSGEEIRAVLNQTAIHPEQTTTHDVHFGNGIVQAKAAYDYLNAEVIKPDNSLCVPDNVGDAPGGDPGLTVSGYKVRGVHHVDFAWSNFADNETVTIQQLNPATEQFFVIHTKTGNGTTSHNLDAKGGGLYIFKACGDSSCTVEVEEVF